MPSPRHFGEEFLDASSHLYKKVCPSVSPSVRRSVVKNGFRRVFLVLQQLSVIAFLLILLLNHAIFGKPITEHIVKEHDNLFNTFNHGMRSKLACNYFTDLFYYIYYFLCLLSSVDIYKERTFCWVFSFALSYQLTALFR